MPLPDRLFKLFYTLPHYVVTAQKKAGKNAKSGEETKTLSHFSKSDVRYWSDVSSAKVIRGTGIAGITREWCARMQLWRSKRFFPVADVQHSSCICEGSGYLYLPRCKWMGGYLGEIEETQAIAQEGDSEQPITVGQFLDAIFRTATTQRTIEGYATAFSQNR